MSDHGSSASSTTGERIGRPRQGLDAITVIDGVAEVTSRSSRVKSREEKAAAFAAFQQHEPQETPVFGRRRSAQQAGAGSSRRQRPENRDLLWQAQAAAAGVGPSPDPAAPRNAAKTKPSPRMPLGQAALAAGAFALGLALIPSFLVALPQSPVAATSLTDPGSAVAIRNVEASLTTRGDGAVLSVAGTIVNETAVPMLVPPLRIAFRHFDGKIETKPFRPDVDRLDPHQSVGFVSLIAVPEGTKGEVSVGPAPMDAARS
ncbi:hypothetical protein [Aurantimonas sp. VKM B-3413]|uniref:hypothetical protein n=1 Tax=Aurantimonas sp. VKM B-3413 TaxID=2779401 RepID=UPI001E4264E9|nr:hypothetical protein [Aurantimonas sp. VKM B-3413]MCB8837234.1 hypothetical protein [Aurantimonas sp. VKM B-3413]